MQKKRIKHNWSSSKKPFPTLLLSYLKCRGWKSSVIALLVFLTVRSRFPNRFCFMKRNCGNFWGSLWISDKKTQIWLMWPFPLCLALKSPLGHWPGFLPNAIHTYAHTHKLPNAKRKKLSDWKQHKGIIL